MSEIKLPEPTAYRLTNTAFRKPIFEYHDTKEQAENRQANFNRSVDDGGLHNLTALFTADQLRAAVEQDRAGLAEEIERLTELATRQGTQLMVNGERIRELEAQCADYRDAASKGVGEVVDAAATLRTRLGTIEAEQQAQRRPMKDWEISERVEEIERWNQMQTQRRPLTDEQVRKEFAKKYPADDVLLTLVEKGCVHELEAIRARARLELFEAGARSVEHGIGEQAQEDTEK